LVGLSSGKNGTGLNVVFAIAVTEIREFLLTARWATNPTSVADHVKRSERFAKVQWWEETLLEMTRALIVEPRSGVAIQRTVEYLVLAGQFGAARKSAERSLEIIPANESSAIHAAIARCLLNDGKTDQALAAADAAIRHDPKNTSALLARAACFLSAEKLAESLKILNDAISLQPNTAEGYFLRSTVYMKKRQFQQALDDASRAIELDPYNPDFLIHRSKIHLTHEDRLMAEADRNAAERLDRENRAR
jgi:tetratricopeptide (TPR) repeat protein